MNNLKFDSKRGRVKECPCGKSNRDGKFSPFQGYDNKGYCHSCGQTFLPELENNNNWMFTRSRREHREHREHVNGVTPSLIDFNLFGKSLINWQDVEQIAERNNLVRYLLTLFNHETVKLLIHYYNIGTSGHWPGATIFWQADKEGNIRSGKVMFYDPTTGKRDKKRFTWAHTILSIPDFQLNQCLFGEHLICNKPIAIVESEKTAIIASVYLPQFTWLATGGKDGLRADRLRSVKHKKVILFPDLNAYDDWTAKARDFNEVGFNITVSSYLQEHTTEDEKKEGLDIADFLIKNNA